MWPGFKEAVIAQEEFPERLDEGVKMWGVKRVGEGKGLGLVATTQIITGQLILSERPLLIAQLKQKWTLSTAHRTNTTNDNDNGSDVNEEPSREEILKVAGPELERILTLIVERMLPRDQRAYRALSNCHSHSQVQAEGDGDDGNDGGDEAEDGERDDCETPLLGILRRGGRRRM